MEKKVDNLKLSKKMILGSVVALLLVALAGFAVVKALSGSFSKEQALAEAFMDSAKKGSFYAKTTGAVDGPTTSLGVNSDLNYLAQDKNNQVFGAIRLVLKNKGEADKDFSVDFRSLLDKKALYVKANNIDQFSYVLQSKLVTAGANGDVITNIINKLNNNWVYYGIQNEIDSASSQCLLGMWNKIKSDSKYEKDLNNSFSKNPFYKVLGVRQTEENQDYTVEFSPENWRKFFMSLVDTEAFKDTEKCRKSLDVFSPKNGQVPTDPNAKLNMQTVVSVDKKSKTISTVSLTGGQKDLMFNAKMDIDYKKVEPTQVPTENVTDMSAIQPELMQLVGSLQANAQKRNQPMAPIK